MHPYICLVMTALRQSQVSPERTQDLVKVVQACCVLNLRQPGIMPFAQGGCVCVLASLAHCQAVHVL